MQKHGSKYFANRHTPDLWWVKRSEHRFLESIHLAYQIKGIEHRAP